MNSGGDLVWFRGIRSNDREFMSHLSESSRSCYLKYPSGFIPIRPLRAIFNFCVSPSHRCTTLEISRFQRVSSMVVRLKVPKPPHLSLFGNDCWVAKISLSPYILSVYLQSLEIFRCCVLPHGTVNRRGENCPTCPSEVADPLNP
jgi:hypothetical protein